MEGLGTFTLNRSTNWFQLDDASWTGESTVQLVFDRGTEEEQTAAQDTARAIWADVDGWDDRLRTYGAQQLPLDGEDVQELSREELAQRLGKSRSAVANSLRLLQLPRPMQDALKDGVFTPGHARAVLALPERALQDILFNAVMMRRLSVRDAEEAVIHWKRHGLLPSSLMGASAPVARSARAPKPACIKLAIRQLRENVAPKASISGTDRAGRITLPYESEEQLAELLSRLGLSVELSEAKPE